MNVLNDLYAHYTQKKDSLVKWVCNASMGHGKTTALICWLKWLTEQEIKVPVLVAVRELDLAARIYKEIHNHKPNSIANVDSSNKSILEDNLYQHQIVIIQHKRLENLVSGYGNSYRYTHYLKNQKRILVIDEKPKFSESAILNIGSEDNILKSLDELASGIDIDPIQYQMIRSQIIFLLSEQLSQNITSTTTRLFINEDNKIRRKNLLSVLDEMEKSEDNKEKIDAIKKLHFLKRLLTKDSMGRIDDYDIKGKKGRKIITSVKLDYAKLGLNLLIFDGTASINDLQYRVLDFEVKHVENRIDYKRLHFHIENINTTKYSRSKRGNTTQKTIAKRISELRKEYPDLFVLPMKSDVEVYKKLGAISEEDMKYFDKSEDSKPINLLNTTGKNMLKDRKSLYLTSLPKMNADYYKEIAVALFGENVSLQMNEENDGGNWFTGMKLEMIYRGEMYAELLQIIHRTALRNINSDDEIHVFIAYDEESDSRIAKGQSVRSISEEINNNYMNGDMNIHRHTIVDMSLYGRDEKVEMFAKEISERIKNERIELPVRVGKFGESFSQYIRKHFKNKQNEINECFKEYKIKIIEKKDRYSNNSKYIDLI